MENGKNDNAFIIFHEENFVREAARECATNRVVDLWKTRRVTLDRIHDGVDRKQEIGTESGDMVFVPVESVHDLGFSFGPDDEPSAHF